jgi:hypothetical protein
MDSRLATRIQQINNKKLSQINKETKTKKKPPGFSFVEE